MYERHNWSDDDAVDKNADRQTASLASVVVILLLLCGGLFLVQQLRAFAAIEDCLMAGRRNCGVLVSQNNSFLRSVASPKNLHM